MYVDILFMRHLSSVASLLTLSHLTILGVVVQEGVFTRIVLNLPGVIFRVRNNVEYLQLLSILTFPSGQKEHSAVLPLSEYLPAGHIVLHW